MTLFFILLFILLVSSSLVIHHSNLGRVLNYTLFGLIFFSVSIGYWQLSGKSYYRSLQEQDRKEKLAKALKQYNGPQGVIQKIEAHLKENPNSAKGWYLLGRLYSSQQKQTNALRAYSRAYSLSPGTRDYAFQYVITKEALSPVESKEEITTVLANLLSKNPKDLELIEFSAERAFHNKQYNMAKQYWESLLPLVPSDGEDYKWLLTAIEKAKKLS